MDKNRKKWVKPKLIVLVRGKSEEGVLTACKVQNGSGPGSSKCQTVDGMGNVIAMCAAPSPS